jgi:FtsP/CotA-like multicopper oxidase with cupredoxin domain
MLTDCKGEFPGPTIEARSGDTLIVHVENALETPDDGVSIHWHGLFMKGYNNMDGAVGFTQCATPPGRNFTYEFLISDDQYGTFWYHAHSQVQRGDGLYGGLVVHRPDGGEVGEAERYGSQNEVLLLVGDWYHRSAGEMLAWYTSVGAFGNEVRTPRFLRLNRLKISLYRIPYKIKLLLYGS